MSRAKIGGILSIIELSGLEIELLLKTERTNR